MLCQRFRFQTKLHPPTKFSEGAFRELDDAVWKLRVAVLGEESAERSPETLPVRRWSVIEGLNGTAILAMRPAVCRVRLSVKQAIARRLTHKAECP